MINKLNLEKIREDYFSGVFGRVLSVIYGFFSKLRNFLYDKDILLSHRSGLKVISVGNITVGGNGKTPLVINLVEEFLKQGQKPVVLSRGYGGTKKGPFIITHESGAKEVGDEPLLIFKKTAVPVVISRDRVSGAKFIEDNKIGDLIILDDGFQHRRLKRDLDILTINLTTEGDLDGFINAELLPKGLFREPRDPACKRADRIVLVSRSTKPLAKEKVEKAKQILPKTVNLQTAYLQVGALPLAPQKIFAFTAIANPQGFFQTLTEIKFEVEHKRIFNDHHQFTAAEIKSMLDTAQSMPLVCTEKDMIKIPKSFAKENIFAISSELVVTAF